MGSRKNHQFPTLRIPDTAKVFVLLAVTTWIAYFWHYASFGLYADDFMRVGGAMDLTWPELRRLLGDLLLMRHGQGRPLHDGLIYLFSFIGLRLGGLHVVYWIAYVLLTVNSFLFYTLLKRLFNQPVFAVTGALAFCLFPAHTTQLWLTTTLGIQPSLTFLLLAIHYYLSRKKKVSYLFILGTLLCYETFFPVFLAAPLLKKKWDYRLIRELVKHALIMGVMMICVVIIRKIFLGAVGVISDLDIMLTISRSINNQLYGPLVSMKMYLYRPVTVLRALIGKESYGELWLVLPLCFAGLVFVLSRLKFARLGNEHPLNIRLATMVDSKVLRLETTELFKSLTKLALVGLIMLVLAYPLTLTTSANSLTSRVHLAAVVGASILFACVCSGILFLARAYRRKHLATVGLAAYFALLIGFGFCVQRDYQLAWEYQRAYWSDVITLIPDFDKETVLFHDMTGLKNPKYIAPFHNLHQGSILSTIYQLPDDWKQAPPSNGFRTRSLWTNGYMLRPNWWEKRIVPAGGDSFQLNPSVMRGSRKENITIKSSNVIFLEVEKGQLTRKTKPLIINGQEFPLKSKLASGIPSFEKGPLYDYLIRSPAEETINYIEQY